MERSKFLQKSTLTYHDMKKNLDPIDENCTDLLSHNKIKNMENG